MPLYTSQLPTGMTFITSGPSSGTGTLTTGSGSFCKIGSGGSFGFLVSNGATNGLWIESAVATAVVGSQGIRSAQPGFTMASNALLAWTDTVNNFYGATMDTGITRAAAGVAQFNNGTAGTLRYFVWAGESRVTTQFDKTNNTLADITGLSINLLAGRTYMFEAILYTTSNVAAGVKFAISGTATVSAIIYEAVVYQTGAAVATGTQRTTTLGTAVGDITAVTTAYARITGTWTVTNAGTMTVQFAQNATNAAASSVLVGSSLVAFDVP